MLVLLIIFMVAAPMMQKGVEVNLPVARRADKMTERAALRDGAGVVSQRSPRLSSTTRRCRSTCWPSACGRRCRHATDKEVFLRGDGGVQLQELMDVFDRLKEGGIEKVGIVAQERRAQQ